jgi:hypothetical protein
MKAGIFATVVIVELMLIAGANAAGESGRQKYCLSHGGQWHYACIAYGQPRRAGFPVPCLKHDWVCSHMH